MVTDFSARFLSSLSTLFVLVCIPALHAEELPVTGMRAARDAAANAAAEPISVRVRGVVTWIWDQTGAFCVQDGSGTALKVEPLLAREKGLLRKNAEESPQITEGLEVEVQGILPPQKRYASLLPEHIKIVGKTPLPPVQPKFSPSALNGNGMYQRAQMTGVVHTCQWVDGKIRLRVEYAIGLYFLVQMPADRVLDPASLIDADVSLTGLLTPVTNAHDAFVYPLVLLKNAEDLVITNAPPKDPFDVPKRRLAEFEGFSPAWRGTHRRRAAGTVTYWDPGRLLYLQERSKAIRVLTDSTEPLQVGDVAEVSGFLETTGMMGELRRALVRKISSGVVPEVQEPNLDAALKSGEIGSYDGLLVKVTGQLLQIQQKSEDERLILVLDAGDSLVNASVGAAKSSKVRQSIETLRMGSTLSVTGVAAVEYGRLVASADAPVATRLDLLLRDENDILLLKPAAWWTRERLLIVLAGVTTVLAASLGWSLTLRRLVRQRSRQLELVMQTHRDAELEFQAAQQERQRLAADMHDGIQQLIAGAAFRLEAATAQTEHLPPAAESQFAAVRATLVRAQTSLRNFLSDSVLVDEEVGDFAALLTHAIQRTEGWPPNAVTVTKDGSPFPLSRQVMGSLLLLVQEAISNAFKHGHARQINVLLLYQASALEMQINDDGTGFDPAEVEGTSKGHFGLESMRHRMRWLGGAVKVASAPGEGTSVQIRLPRAQAQSTRRLVSSKQPTQAS